MMPTFRASPSEAPLGEPEDGASWPPPQADRPRAVSYTHLILVAVVVLVLVGSPLVGQKAVSYTHLRYLQFVDGDDYLPSTATERLVRTAGATGADLVIGRFWRVAGTRKALQGHILSLIHI